jgi:excisionase family DNA binding protein
MERLMTIDEVAGYLRVPVLTVRWLRQEGRFAPAVKVGRRLVWEECDRGVGRREPGADRVGVGPALRHC